MSTLLRAAMDYAAARPDEVAQAFIRHLALCGAALGIGLLLALPAGIVSARRRGFAEAVIGVFNGVRVVPSLAILFLAVPLLGIGFRPALVALVALACPPILLATHAALRGVPAAVREAAFGLGMSPGQVLARVDLPLAAPVMLSGVRTATVEVNASATLAAFIGAGGLGDLIARGFATNRVEIMLVGAVPIALLALLAEGAFGVADATIRRAIGQARPA